MSDVAVADTINEAATEPIPYMQRPLSNQIELLRGLQETVDGTTMWHSVATVKELTGSDEEYLASIESKDGLTYTEYMSAILERAVVSIGDLSIKDIKGVVNKLILPDRDMLFLGVLRSTYGTEREIRAMCAKCGAMNDIVIDLDDDFPIKRPDFDIKQPIEVTVGTVTYKLRPPNGEDTIEAQKLSKTDAELNTVMLSRCAVFEDNAPSDTLEWARNLNVNTRRKLINSLLDLDELGPSLEGVDTHCADCGTAMPILLDWVSLLLS